MGGKKALRIILPLAVAVGIAVGLYLFFHRGPSSTATLRLFGNVDIRQVQLAFHDTGRIQRILVQEGAPVKAGALVAALDPIRFEAAADRARARVAAQKEVLAKLLAGSRPEEIAEAAARVRAAKATLEDAEQTYRRTKALARTKYVSEQKLDNALAALQNARASLDAAKQAHVLAVKGPREEDIAAARAQLQEDQAALKLAERQLADTRLLAPADGVIQNRILEPGDMAFPQTPVLTLALNNPIWVRAYVPEPDLGKVSLGMAATVHTDSFPGKVYRGWVGFISPTAEFTPKRVETSELRSKLVYRVRVYVCNPANELRLGMPVTVDILLKAERRAVDSGAANPCPGE
ncbi:MAG: efflux RND transporter periplasmic adaptor subunit [Deltaproteobacteria bacterium]|jgi:HlyD family secretion protein